MKRAAVWILTVLLLLSAVPSAADAAFVSSAEAVETLSALDLLRGTEDGYALDRPATRAEATVLLLRLLGLERSAAQETGPCPFDDGGWAAAALTYAWKNGLVCGQNAGHFGSASPVGSRDYVTMLLRALGYSDAQGDFSWAQSLAFADAVGLCHGEYTAQGAFLREDVALLTYTALTLPVKGTEQTLAERLYLNGALSGAALRATRLRWAAAADKPVYDASEIHERCGSAVFLAELYPDQRALEQERLSGYGSGFFITADGVALMCWHELDGCEYARVRTADGRCYPVTGVLHYDPLWDIALVRVSRTDTEGETVRFFPWLDLGDSDDITAGERVYTLSSALGLMDNITDGVLSNRSRAVDDPDYLCIQISAPISPGSSGGALLNRHGEVIGVIFGSFLRGENMNLAVPVNVISAVPLTGEGTALPEIKQTEDAKKRAAVISVSQTELELPCGEIADILVTHTAPGRAALRCQVIGADVVECAWGSSVSKHAVPLSVRGLRPGTAELVIRFDDAAYSEDAEITVRVTVTEGADPDAGYPVLVSEN